MKNKKIKRCFAKNVDLLYTMGLESNAGKEFLKLSKNEQISFLCDEIERETEKPLEEMDSEKLDFYADLLEVISESPEGMLVDKGLDMLFYEIAEKHKKIVSNSTTTIKGSVVKRKAWKRVAVIAATIALLLCTTSVVCAINGVNVFEKLYELGMDIFDLEKGKEHDIENITFIRNNDVREYNTINEFFIGENILGVYYPECIPENESPINVSVKEIKGNISIKILFENNHFGIHVESSDVYRLNELEGMETYFAKNGINAIYFCENGNYQFMFQIDEWYYAITTYNYDHAISCIESMTEIK